MRSKQEGFGAVHFLGVLVIIGLVGLFGWFVWQNQKSATTATSKKTTASSLATNSSSTDGYLVIKEWGVKIKMTNAAKLTYSYNAVTNTAGGYLSVNTDSNVTVEVKPEFISDKNCAMTDLKWGRSSQKADINTTISHVGSYYYYLWGDGGSNDCNASDKAIRNQVTADQQANKFETL